MKVLSYDARVKDENGLHAQVSATLVQKLSKFHGEFQIVKDNGNFDMKSILGLISLALYSNSLVTIRIALHQEKGHAEVLNVLNEYFELSNEKTII
jgi:phosphotransferase system HPr (HPr) family protein